MPIRITNDQFLCAARRFSRTKVSGPQKVMKRRKKDVSDRWRFFVPFCVFCGSILTVFWFRRYRAGSSAVLFFRSVRHSGALFLSLRFFAALCIFALRHKAGNAPSPVEASISFLTLPYPLINSRDGGFVVPLNSGSRLGSAELRVCRSCRR